MIPNHSSDDRIKLILGAGRVRNLGYPFLANSLVKYALGVPDSDQELERALLQVGPDTWAWIKRELQRPPFDIEH